MKKKVKFILDNKLKFGLIFTLIILIVYIFLIGKFANDNIKQIRFISKDINNKLIDNQNIVKKITIINNENIITNENIIEDEVIMEKIQYDLYTDESINKFVTSDKSFDNKSYVPNDLVKISSKYVYDSKGGTQQLRKISNDNLQRMAEDFYNDFGESIVIVSAYRSYAYQKGIKDRGCPDNLCAKAGYSEHQSGLAMDLWEASSNYDWKVNSKLQKYFKWLNENAYKYGFHNTYQKGLKIDGYEIEPWHWRYLGVEFATYLRDNNLTIAEFYKNN